MNTAPTLHAQPSPQGLEEVAGALYPTDEDNYESEPQNVAARELPVYGVPPPDRVWQIEAVINQLIVGKLHDAAWLWDAMKRDARIRGCLKMRAQGLFGSGLECDSEPDDGMSTHGNSTSAKQALIAAELHHAWFDMHDAAELAKAYDYALGLGVCVLEKVYHSAERWDYHLKCWHPQFLYWRWDDGDGGGRYYMYTANLGEVALPRPGEKSSQWIVLCPFGFGYAFLEGLVLALAPLFLGRGWDQSDWSRYNEIHSRAVRLAIVPENAKDANKKAFFSQVANLHAEAAIRVPQDKDGKGYDVKYLEAVADTWKTIAEKLKYEDKTVSNLILGQSTSTDGSTGLGSDKDPGDTVRVDIKKFDNAWMSMALYRQGIREWVAFNWGDPDLAPIPPMDDKRSGYWQVEPAEDSAKRATELKDFATGFVALTSKTDAIKERVRLDSFGLPLETEEEEARKKADREQKARDIAQPAPGNQPPNKMPPSKALSKARRRWVAADVLMGDAEYLRGQKFGDVGARVRAQWPAMAAAQRARLVAAIQSQET